MADRPDTQLEFETLISELSARFIHLPPGEVDRGIEEALRRVCGLLGLDLAVLWQWSHATADVIAPTHAASTLGATPALEPMRQEDFPWYRQQMLAGRVVSIASLDELPAEAAVDRESGRAGGIQSNLCLPLSVGGEPPLGALALSTLRAARTWDDAVLKRLQLVAQVFSNALARQRHEAERKRTDEALRRSEARLASGAELAGLAFYEVDSGAGSTFVDDRFRELCGLPQERDAGVEATAYWLEHLHPDDRPQVVHLRQQLHDGRVDDVSVEYRYLHPVLGERWIHHLARISRRDASGKATVTFGVLRDITDRKHAEGERLDLGRRLLRAHEEERALLARELHDDVTQRLAVLAIDVGRAELAAKGGAHAEAMRALREGLTRLSEDVHSLAYQLHPSVLEELGLAEALRAECERLSRQGRLAFSVDVGPLPDALERDAALCLFRVAQEALRNVTRHADARTASVALRQLDGGVLLAVRDDGGGFDPKSNGARRSLGLASMRERVQLVNGTLDVESEPGRGTAVTAWVPVGGATP